MQSLNFTEQEDTTTREMSQKNIQLSKLLREQQAFIMEGNDYMVERLGRLIEKLTQSITPPIKEHEEDPKG